MGLSFPFYTWFLKPNEIYHIIVSTRKGHILCLNPLSPHVPEHAFAESSLQKVNGMGPTVQNPLKGRRKQESQCVVCGSKERQVE